MSRSKDAWQQQIDTEALIALEREDAAYFATPDALRNTLTTTQTVHKNLLQLMQENNDLRQQVTVLQNQIDFDNRPAAKWIERGYGFIFGCIASIVASLIWWTLTKIFAKLS